MPCLLTVRKFKSEKQLLTAFKAGEKLYCYKPGYENHVPGNGSTIVKGCPDAKHGVKVTVRDFLITGIDKVR